MRQIEGIVYPLVPIAYLWMWTRRIIDAGHYTVLEKGEMG